MSKPFRIAVAGIGGVGGFYAALLSKAYEHNRDYEITVLARSESKKVLETTGLTLHYNNEILVTHPHRVTADPSGDGFYDLIMLCSKSYDLPDMLQLLKNNIGPETYVLPLQNGVESNSIIAQEYPQAKLLTGCVYIVSKRTAPGVITVKGSYNRLLFGSSTLPEKELQQLETIFTGAGINTERYADIESKVWEKFTFISPVATYTSAYNINLGNILAQPEHLEPFSALMQEVIAVARKNGIALPADCFEKNMNVVRSLPPSTTSSMHADLIAGHRTEVETLTQFVLRKAHELDVPAPQYSRIGQMIYFQLYR